jgi:hypothetical protein
MTSIVHQRFGHPKVRDPLIVAFICGKPSLFNALWGANLLVPATDDAVPCPVGGVYAHATTPC